MKKRESLIRVHMLGLMDNLHQRIEQLERDAGLSAEEAEAFTELFKCIKIEETRNLELHTILISGCIKANR